MAVSLSRAAGISTKQACAKQACAVISRPKLSPVVSHSGCGWPRAVRSAAEAPATSNSTSRAVLGLLRIEQDGAYAALLSHSSPSKTSQQNQSETRRLNSESKSGNTRETADLQSSVDSREARQTTWLVAGATKWRRQLDVIISNLLQRSTDDLDAAVRQILRIAVLEVVHSDLADHAISAHVDLCSAAGHARASGLVNAALRKLLRERQDGNLAAVIPQLPAPYLGEYSEGRKPRRQRARAIAIATSHPTWLVSRWLKQYGEQATVALCHHNNRGAPEYGVRVNTLRSAAEPLLQHLLEAGADATHSPLLPGEFLRVARGMQAVLRGGSVAEGRASVQDEAAGLVVALALRPRPHDTVLDTCAAPGGKALFAAARMRRGAALQGAEAAAAGPGAAAAGGGLVVAADVRDSRLGLISRAAELWGLQESVVTVAGDLRERSSPRGFDMHGVSHPGLSAGSTGARQFDAVLVDAPCSGTGVLCKRADLRWQRSAEQVADMVALQRQLLGAAVPCVRPGGVLVYSTCSLEAEENERQVEWLLGQFPEVLEVERITDADLEGAGVPVATGTGAASTGLGVVSEQGYLRCLPHVHGCDGSFAARIRVRG